MRFIIIFMFYKVIKAPVVKIIKIQLKKIIKKTGKKIVDRLRHRK